MIYNAAMRARQADGVAGRGLGQDEGGRAPRRRPGQQLFLGRRRLAGKWAVASPGGAGPTTLPTTLPTTTQSPARSRGIGISRNKTRGNGKSEWRGSGSMDGARARRAAARVRGRNATFPRRGRRGGFRKYIAGRRGPNALARAARIGLDWVRGLAHAHTRKDTHTLTRARPAETATLWPAWGGGRRRAASTPHTVGHRRQMSTEAAVTHRRRGTLKGECREWRRAQ